tara:strand:+ start:287 stop:895 length:609 start_codon:yes stop_codon:yes gene_type:complete
MVERDYSKGLIYKIVCNDIECKNIYVGSTISFKHRKTAHKTICNNKNSKKYNLKVYQTIRNNGDWDNWKMVLVEYYPCETKLELEKREREIYEELKADLNMIKPCISEKERKENKKKHGKKWIDNNKEKIKEYQKEYQENNKEKEKEKRKQYRIKNKEKIKEYQKEYTQQKINCQCGSIIRKDIKLRHERTKKHIKYMEQQK